MKFRVEPKDFILFVVYCVILLYLCAIVVVNAVNLLSGEDLTLSPFLAFSPKYIVTTFIIFIAVLVGIFASVSSYIFSKDKGHGFGLSIKEKKESGYERWASDKEMKNASDIVKVNPAAETLDAAGIPLINNGKEIWVDNGEYHNLVIGSTGSGKSQQLVFPMIRLLAKKGESMIITDPKGELYTKTSENLKKRGYKVIVLNFREPQRGNSWNPLGMPYTYYKSGNRDKAIELLDDVAQNILYDPTNKSEPFWEKGAADYFSGLALGLFEDATEKEVNLNSINLMATVGEERYAGTSNYIKEYFNIKGPNHDATIFASTTVNAPNDTKGSLLSTFRQKVRMFTTRQNLSEMLSYSDFDMRDIGKGKTAVFMVIHDEKKTYHSLLTIFIKQVYETLIDEAQKSGGKLPIRTNFILDEFANMPPLSDADSMVSAARSRDIRFTFIIQNFAQLNDVYGEEVAQVIRGNCGNIIYLISTELKALEEISKMCGEVKSKKDDKTSSTPLVTITDLQKLKLGEAIIKRLRMSPYKTKYVPDFKMDWQEEYPTGDYPTRVVRELQYFDLKKFVTEEKKKQMMNGDIPQTFNNPFSMANNPFMNRPERPQNPMGMGMGMPQNVDKMIADIEKRIKEIDEEEERRKKQKEENNKSDNLTTKLPNVPLNEADSNVVNTTTTPNRFFNDNFREEKSETLDEKPKVNVDVDSIIVNENVISDDEFFDDFFGDDN